MRLFVRAAAAAVVSVVALAGPAAEGASAEEKVCGGPGRPPCSILRPAEPALAIDRTSRLGPRCIVVVGGFDSTSGDRAFDELLQWTSDDPSFRVKFFGGPRDDGLGRDERSPYDTTGPIDESAETLGLFVHSLKTECSAFDLLTHSMGGAVADRAFAAGWLSAADGIETYTALSGPHNGAALAKALRPPIEKDPIIALELSALARSLGQADPTSAAARDLATLRPPSRTIRDVSTARLRLATDAMVLRRDTVDRRFEVREYMPELARDQIDGHGGILHTADVHSVIHDLLIAHEIDADTRAPREREIVTAVSRAVDAAVGAAYTALSDHLSLDPMARVQLAEVTIPAVIARAVADVIRSFAGDPPGR